MKILHSQLVPQDIGSRQLSLLDIVDRILDKGLVINGEISLTLAGTDVLSLRINLVLASIETARRYGLELPWEKWKREERSLAQKRKKEVKAK